MPGGSWVASLFRIKLARSLENRFNRVRRILRNRLVSRLFGSIWRGKPAESENARED
jgi:hypothetical protein